MIHTRALFVFGVRPDRASNRMSDNVIGALPSLLLDVLNIVVTKESKTKWPARYVTAAWKCS